MKKLILILVLSSCVVAQTNLHVNNINADGFINSIAGFEINGIAPANSFLKSNGTKYVSGSPILASADFANQGTVATVLHGNAAGNPSFGSVTGSDLNITSTICANQFVRTIGVNALGTCATVGTNDLAPSLGLVTPNVGAATGTSLNITGQYTSTLATGTPPLVVSSTTNVPNLNASTLSGKTHADPGPIGSGTPSTGAFTTLSATGLEVVKAPVEGEPLPIGPGSAWVFPLRVEAFRFGTLVVDETTSGGVPVAKVLVYCPVMFRLVPVAAPTLGVTNPSEGARSLVPTVAHVPNALTPIVRTN